MESAQSSVAGIMLQWRRDMEGSGIPRGRNDEHAIGRQKSSETLHRGKSLRRVWKAEVHQSTGRGGRMRHRGLLGVYEDTEEQRGQGRG